MNNNDNTPTTCSNKDNNSKLIINCLAKIPKTRRQIEAETGIHYNTIDWEVNKLQKVDLIFIAYKGVCPISQSDGVQFLTTNKSFRPKLDAVQLKIFKND